MAAAAPALVLIRNTPADASVGRAMALALPAAPERWQLDGSRPAGWQIAPEGPEATVTGAYKSGSRRALLHIGYVSDIRGRARLSDREGGLHVPNWWRSAEQGIATLELEGRAIRVPYTRYTSRAGCTIVARWLWLDGGFVGNAYWARLLRAKIDLIGGPRSAASIVLAVEYDDADEHPERVLSDFLTGMQPLTPLLKRAAEH